jgi:hypothetical protein
VENSSVTYEQAFWVYKIMGMPIELLEKALAKVQLNRKVLKNLHPDKNRHPGAKEAF